MLLNTVPTFYIGLCLIVAGTGLLKPNASTMVGDLYDKDDQRRDAGFSIFYMGINLGAFIGPIITSYLGQKIAWHYGFGAAGFGMVLGVIQYVLGSRSLGTAGLLKKKEDKASKEHVVQPPLTRNEKTRLVAICILVLFSIVFFMGFEQQGSSMNLFSDRLVNWHIFGKDFPSGLNQSIEPIYVILLAPVLALIWTMMKDRQPSSPVKFALGLFFLGIGNAIMVLASAMTATGKVSVMWLVGAFFFIAVGELCLSPVGLSTVSQLAPARFVGFMMGVWFLSISMGNKLAGMVAGTFDEKNQASLYKLFGGLTIEVVLAGVILLLLTPFIKRLIAQNPPAAN
jgi:POT family proton-dependent oligopeptide transporter